MTLSQWVMRLVSPACEKQRQEFRHALAAAHAHAEDLTRTVTEMKPYAPFPRIKAESSSR